MRRILVADDSRVALAAIARPLEEAGAEVLRAASAAEALAHVSSEISAALLDLSLGDEWGDEVALLLRQKLPDLPIAFFSAGGDDNHWNRATELGPVFKKPDELKSAVAWALTKIR